MFGVNASRFTEAVNAKMDELYLGKQTQENGTEQPTGPPTESRSFTEEVETQLRGEPGGQKENTDETGGERYSAENVSVDELTDAEYDKLARDLELRGDPRKMPRNPREWRAFNRSFANKTSEMKKGEERKILICTHRNMYYVTADGYMRGYAEDKLSISNKNMPMLKAMWRFVYGFDREAETPSAWIDDFRSEQGHAAGDIHGVRNGAAAEPNAGVYGSIYDGSGTEKADRAATVDGALEDSWVYEIEEYAPGAIVYDGRGEAYRANEEGFLIPLDLDFDGYYIRQKVRMVFDKVSANHAAQMEKYTELKDSDPEAAQRFYDGLMAGPYAAEFEEYLKLTEELAELEAKANTAENADGESDGAYTERASLDDEVRYSLDEDSALADKAIAKNDSLGFVDDTVLEEAKQLRERTADQMRTMKENGVAIPDDIKGIRPYPPTIFCTRRERCPQRSVLPIFRHT